MSDSNRDPSHVRVALQVEGQHIVLRFDRPTTSLEMTRADAEEYMRRLAVLLTQMP